MLKAARILAMGAAAGAACLAPAAFAQGGGGAPTAEQIARGKTFVGPKVGDYAKRLADQPDFMGSWNYTSQSRQVQSTIFDPANAFVPYDLPEGEQEFGPRPGTYIRGIPYKPEYQKKYMDLVKGATEGVLADTFALCVPYGVPRMIGGAAGPMDIIQSPEVIIVHNSYSTDTRRIFLDGRAHPNPNGPEGTDARTLTGHSVGHFEGDTLVVDTVNMVEGSYDETPAPYSNQIHLVERIRLIDTNILQDEMTITDPVMLERPWVVTRYFRRTANMSGAPGPGGPAGGEIVHQFHNMADRICVPNVRLENGTQVMVLPQELEEQAKKTPAKSSKAKGNQR